MSQKLSKRYFGPFKVLRRIGSVAYELELPPSSRIHPVFPVSQLRAYHGQDQNAVITPLPDTLSETEVSDTIGELNGEDQRVQAVLRRKELRENEGTTKALSEVAVESTRYCEKVLSEDQDLSHAN